jgi:hypothetical protein
MYKLENEEELTDEIKKAFCKNNTYGILRNNDYTIDINNYLKSIDYTDEKYDEEDGTFLGKAASRSIEVNLINANSLNIENQEFELLMGAKTNDGKIHYINYGKFIIIEPPEIKDVEGSVNFIAYDYMEKFNIEFDASGIPFPCTYFELAEYICEKSGVQLGSTEFRNSDKTISENPFVNHEKNRLVLQCIAKIAFSVAYIGQDNKLYIGFDNKTSIDEELTTNNYFELESNESIKPITVLTLRNSTVTDDTVSIKTDDEEMLEKYGENELLIEEDYFTVTDSLRLEYLDSAKDLFGLVYDPIELKLEGNIYLSFNDRIKNTDLKNIERETYCLNTYFTYNGVLLNSIKSSALTENESKYNYETEEELYKKITEIRINKAEQQIESLVYNMYEEDGIVNENFTKVTQTTTNIINNVQNSGGSNLIKNSVMFAYDTDDVPSDWTIEEGGTLIIGSSAESLSNGCLSGHVFTLADKIVSQKISVKADSVSIPDNEKTYYSFSTKIKKNTVGTCYVKIYNSFEEYIIEIDNGTSAFYKEYTIKSILPKDSYYIIEFYGDSDSGATFTDNMFTVGSYVSQWTQANGEIMNTQVNVNVDGVLVKSSQYEDTYTVMSPLEFAGYSNNVKVFTVNQDTTEVTKLKSKDEITMSPIKIVPVTEGEIQGWAFVPISD